MNRKQKKVFYRIIAAAVLLIGAFFIPQGIFRAAVQLAAYIVIGHDILRKAFRGIINRQIFDESFLMAAATVGALLLGEFTEAVAVMLFFQMGELFEGIAVGKSRKSIAALMDIRPPHANIESEDGQLVKIDPEEVSPGSIIVVLPGERLPIDGTVTEGESSLDCSALTGESLPRDVGVGDSVLSGSVNLRGLLKVRTFKRYEDSTVARILELVENAAERKSKSESFISRFARYYTPVVCISALALAVLPPVVSIGFGNAPDWGDWIYRALSFLVISCPCALVISVPLSFFAGLGGAGSEGILIKGSNYLELLSKVKCIVFDKTGTLTKGSFSVKDVIAKNISKDELLSLAAHVEYNSTHPIARSIVSACVKKPEPACIENIEELGGFGMKACIDGRTVAVGNRRLMEAIGVSCPEEVEGGTCVYVCRDGEYLGQIVLADTPKDGAAPALEKLRAMGIHEQVMLTGDNENAARYTAKELGISKVYARLLPEDKVAKVEELLSSVPKAQALAFVGDGINDAPVLSRADIGIAMGALGSDAAIEAADVVLMDDDPGKIAKAVGISKKCMRIVRENIVFSLGIKLLFLVLTALGLSNMWFAIFADVGVMVLAVLNAVRMLNVKKI